jgi:uncharacterized membrane protein
MFSTSHLHPLLVHFPVALIIFAFIAIVASLIFIKETWLSRSAFYLLIFGTLSALVAILTGALFTSEMSGSAGEMKETHELFAKITLCLLISTLALQIAVNTKNKENTGLKWLTILLYGLSAISVSITGFYGGTLVYSYMMPL